MEWAWGGSGKSPGSLGRVNTVLWKTVDGILDQGGGAKRREGAPGLRWDWWGSKWVFDPFRHSGGNDASFFEPGLCSWSGLVGKFIPIFDPFLCHCLTPGLRSSGAQRTLASRLRTLRNGSAPGGKAEVPSWARATLWLTHFSWRVLCKCWFESGVLLKSVQHKRSHPSARGRGPGPGEEVTYQQPSFLDAGKLSEV